MFRKPASIIILSLLAVSALALAFSVQPVKSDYVWTETIYIRADGSIQPPAAPISSVDNVTYTLTDNVTGNVPANSSAIVIQRDNITIDGAAHTLQGIQAEESKGIELTGRSNVTIENVKITTFVYGIELYSSSNNNVSGNNITNNMIGLYLYSSSNNSVSGNNMTANNGDGIEFDSSSNNSVSGNNITANEWFGIWLSSSSDNNVSGNNITNGRYGIYLNSSSNNSVSGNNITANAFFGIVLGSSSGDSVSGNLFVNDGLFVDDSYGNVVTDNLVNGKPLVYLEDVSDYAVGDAGQVILVKCNNVTVENLNLPNATIGVELWETNNTQISGNNITANLVGGILLYSSSNNNVSGNNITNKNWAGIELSNSSNNGISGNNMTNDWYGIVLDSSSNNSVSGNNITANILAGINLYSASNNTIYHNNFINNKSQVSSSNSTNVWDNGYPSFGNYWSDYSGNDSFSGPFQNVTGSDGIGDAPYLVDAVSSDRYPLMNPWKNPAFGDLNNDGKVDGKDIAIVALAFGSTPADPRWDALTDVNGDQRVDAKDIAIIALHFGQANFP